MEAVIAVLQVLATIGGALLCYAGAFLYEDEEENVQNILEQWWVKLDDRRARAIAAHVAFTRKAARMLSYLLNHLFGHRLLSVRAIATSGCLSFVSFLGAVKYLDAGGTDAVIATGSLMNGRLAQDIHATVFGFAGIFATLLKPQAPLLLDGVAIMAIVAVIIAVRGRLVHGPTFVFGILLFLLLLGYLTSRFTSPITGLPDVAALALTLGIASDVVALAVTRKLIAWQAEWKSIGKIALAATAELLTALLLAVGAPALAVALAMNNDLQPPPGFHIVVVMTNTRAAIFYSALTNAAAFVVAISLFCVLGILIAHRLAWPMLERPLYQLARGRLFRSAASRAAVFSCGAGVIWAAYGGENAWQKLMALWH